MTIEEFKQEIRPLRSKLINLAKRYLKDTDEAEDAVQDTLLKLWQMHDGLHSPIAPIASVVTRNLCIDRLRRIRPTELTEALEADGESQDDPRIERILEIINTLPCMQQIVLKLRHMEGKEMKEIVEITGSTEVAVRKALSRARMAVRQEYLKKQT